MFTKFLLTVILIVQFLAGSTLKGQDSRPPSGDKLVRVEIPVRSTDETYHIIPLDSTGILLFFKSVETVNDSLTKWYFSLYDNSLKPLWVKSVPVRTGLEIRDNFRGKEMITFLFLANEKTKIAGGGEMILRLDCKSGKFTGTRFALSGNIVPSEFLVFKNTTFLGYNQKNEPAHMQITDLDSGKVADYPLTFPGVKSILTGFILDTLTGSFYATINKPVSKNNVACDLVRMSFSGKPLSEIAINTVSPMWEIRNPQLILVNPDELLLIANYSVSGRSEKNVSFSGASGFYTCRFKYGIQTDIRLKNFLDLKNFKNIVGEKDLAAIQKKASKKNKPVNDFVSEINLLIHPLYIHNDQIVFMGESFVPEYHPENFTEFDFYGRPYINTYNVFDGYRYTSAVVAGFDNTGSLKWDNTMEIRNLISTELTPKVNLYFASADTMVLCYSSEARIASKIIRMNDIVEKLDFSSLEQMNPEDKMISDTKNFMVPWYGPYFLCYGYQEIKNINSSENKKRLVYYFTKVKFD
ncbi:MAG: hypothetical protein NTW10_05345 [Bacteroidetes bacterium]|nr:hypothetical protein [Bacteroidota bacterium]